MGKREPQIILRPTSARWCSNSASKGNSPGWTKIGSSSKGDRLEVAVKSGRWVLTHVPATPPAPKPVLHYWPDHE